MNAPRPTWDETWMSTAFVQSRRSRCANRQVGAVIVTEANRPVSMGYNGPPAGFDVADDGTCSSWCPRAQTGVQTIEYSNCVAVHAEINALMFADRRDYVGGTLYVTSSVCWDCGRAVANSGIARVVMHLDQARDAHRSPYRTIGFMRSCGLEVACL